MEDACSLDEKKRKMNYQREGITGSLKMKFLNTYMYVPLNDIKRK